MSDDRASFVAKIQDGLERRRLAKYQPYCTNPIIGYRTAAITKRMKREKRKFYR